MAKGFKLQLFFPSIRFCRSRQSSSLPRSPLAVVNPKMFDVSYPKLPAPPSTPNHPNTPFKSTPIGSKLSTICEISHSNTDSQTLISKLCNSPVLEEAEESAWTIENWTGSEKGNNKDPFLTSFSLNFSSEELGGWLSSDYNSQEMETLLSSYSLNTINEAKAYGINRKKKNPKAQTLTRRNSWKSSEKTMVLETLPENDQVSSPEKKTVFEKLMPCMVEGKVNESYAVMKKSEDPYEDFKKSMMEMILQKQISEAEDLEKLLMCFLSLNSKDHHQVIVEAFSEVWEDLFSSNSLALKLH